MNPIVEMLKSKKVIAAFAGLVAVVVAHYARMPEERIAEITAIVVGLLGALASADFGKAGKQIEAASKTDPFRKDRAS